MPFLTTMGLAAALAVVVAVLIAVTLIPALPTGAGERLRSRKPRKPPKTSKINFFIIGYASRRAARSSPSS
jgi:RND superfamily putative drug exporter